MMKPRTSEIFDSYIKIAEEIGMVEKPEKVPEKPKESAKLRKYKKSPHPRVGSDDIDTIKALYNVKPDSSIEYEHCIMEAAHPKPVVIGPAYDRLNALVENNIERQNIMSNIALKPNNGLGDSQYRYAEKELLMQLVRIANDMDNRGNDDLRKLADECIETLKKNADFGEDVGKWWDKAKTWMTEKGKDTLNTGTGALAGGSVGGILGGIIGAVGGPIGILGGAAIGAGIGALVSALGKTAPHVVDIATNTKDTIDQINDLKNKMTQGDPEYTFFDRFQTELTKLASVASLFSKLISSIEINPSLPHGKEQSEAITKSFLEQVGIVEEMEKLFSAKVERGVYNKYTEHSKVFTPFTSMVADDVKDVEQSLESLTTAIENFEKSLNIFGNTTQQIAQSSRSVTSPTGVPTASNAAPEEDYSDLFGAKPSKDEYAALRQMK
jgi:hypothetical protein